MEQHEDKISFEEEIVKEKKDGSMLITAEGSVQSSKDRILPISILVAAVMITSAIVFATIYRGGSGAGNGNAGANNVAGNNVAANAGGAAAGAVAPSASTTAILALGPRDAILGNANAPVTVIEYGDYQCPFCTQYFSTLEPVITQNYINTGEVKMAFRNFPFLGPESIAAAQAAECAEDQNQLWLYHNALYSAKVADDAKGGGENDGLFTRTLFMNIASQLHMNTTQFANCIDSNKYAALVNQEKNDGVTAGVNSTPTTFVNGVMVTDSGGNSVGANSTAILATIANAVAAAK